MAELPKHIADTFKAMIEIERASGLKPGSRGEVQCPACGAKLFYVVASNGHTRGACPTAGCLAWIE